MSIDRLSELRRGGDVEVELARGGISSPAQIEQYLYPAHLFDQLETCTANLGKACDMVHQASTDARTTAHTVLAQSSTTQATAAMRELKLALEKVKDSNMRAFYTQKLVTGQAAYYRKLDLYTKRSTSASRRQLRIVDPDLTDEQTDVILDGGPDRVREVLRRALVSDNLQSVIDDIETRHRTILALQRQVEEIFELFRDLATLVDLQQESLDVIELRITKAHQWVEKGEADLNQAEDYSRKARNRKCCCLMICVGILAAIILPTSLALSHA